MLDADSAGQVVQQSVFLVRELEMELQRLVVHEFSMKAKFG